MQANNSSNANSHNQPGYEAGAIDSGSRESAVVGGHTVQAVQETTSQFQPHCSVGEQNTANNQPIESKNITLQDSSLPNSIQLLSSNQEERVLSDEEVRQIRYELVTTVFRFLTLKHRECEGYPLIIGPIANTCLQLNSDCAVDPTFAFVALTNHPEIDIVAASPEQFSDLTSVFNRLLANKSIKRDSIMDSNGHMLFKYGTGNEIHAAIRLSFRQPGSHFTNIQPCTVPVDNGTKSVKVFASNSNRAQLIVVWNQLCGLMTIEQLTNASIIINSIDPASICEADAFLYGAVMDAYWRHFLQYFPGAVAVSPAETAAQETVAIAIKQETQATVTDSSLPGHPDQHSLEPRLESSVFCESLHNLKRDNPREIDLSYEKIAAMFESVSSNISIAMSGTKQKNARTVANKKEAKKNKMQEKEAKIKQQARRVACQQRPQISAAVMALSHSVDKTAKREFLEETFSALLANRITQFVAMEAKSAKKRYDFPVTPYLGHSYCTLATSGSAVQQGNPELAEELRTLLPDLLNEVSEEKISGGLDQYEREFAALSILMLKYSVYENDGDLKTYDALMSKLAQLIHKIAQAASNPEHKGRGGVWRILPQTMLIMLSAHTTRQLAFSAETSENILSSLGETMKAACVQGDFDLSASVVSLLNQNASSFTCYLASPQVKPLFNQIDIFFHMLSSMMQKTERSSHTQICTARVVQELAGDLRALMKNWPYAEISDTELATAEMRAGEVLEKQKQDIEALDNEIKQLAITADQKKKSAQEKIKAARNKRKQTLEKSEKCAAIPAVETAEEAKVLPVKEAKWVKLRGKAVEQFTLERPGDGKKMMVEALCATKNNMDQACIYTDCGDAQTLSCKKLINQVCYLGNRCDKELQHMNNLLEKVQNTFTRPPERHTAHTWLRDHQFSSAESLACLMEKFPSATEIASAAAAIDEAIDLYSKALGLLKQCTAEEMKEHGQFMLEIMESDLIRLHEKRGLISSAKKNLSKTTKIRHQVLYHLGLYGRQLAPQQAADRTTSVVNNTDLKQKNWFTQAQNQFNAEAEELSGLFRVRKGKGDKLNQLIADINALRAGISVIKENTPNPDLEK